ncbi:MAG: flavin oxidoreductase/NADH oxidase [Clostridiales bacterium]|jgi:2,4-dienoyl-CoA reductase-like NADH-dependent reductase (Old Yellow Enzyme family)|nr:flavin oxidoreductase/NADH oxidase [Clostridiales bacterium]
MRHEKFHYPDLSALNAELTRLNVTLPLSENIGALASPVTVGKLTVRNRLAVQPMEGCDGTPDGKPGELTLRRYDRFTDGGAALIWVEACAVVREGRANPRQLWLHEENVDAFKSLVSRIRERGIQANGFAPVLILQLTHSGRYSKPEGTPAPLIAYNNPLFEKEKPIDPSRILSDDRLDALPEVFAKAAKLAEEAGFDGVDVKACHRYLICEMFSGFTRPGKYGGSFENRTRLYLDCVRAAKAAVSADFLVTSRMNVYDGFPYPYGWGVGTDGSLTPDLTEPLRLIGLARETGFPLLDVTIGNPYVNPHVNRPYDLGGYIPPEHPLEGVARMYDCVGAVKRAYPEMTVIGSGLSYLRGLSGNLAAGAVEQDYCDIAGFGRLAFAYPDFARDLLTKGTLDPKKICITCSKCTELMRAGSTPGCVLRDKLYTELYKEVFRK